MQKFIFEGKLNMLHKSFINDFEKKLKKLDYLHEVLGSILIISTRFDSRCISLSQTIDIKLGVIFVPPKKNLRIFLK